MLFSERNSDFDAVKIPREKTRFDPDKNFIVLTLKTKKPILSVIKRIPKMYKYIKKYTSKIEN